MGKFIEYLTNKEYVTAYNFNGKGILYVEDESDVQFWTNVINKIATNKYDVRIANTHDLKDDDCSEEKVDRRGKRFLEKLYDSLNCQALVGVDSDFDYLCPDSSSASKKLNESKYILHTFAYSYESVIYCDELLNDVSLNICYSEKNQCNISDLIIVFSNNIYEILNIFSYLKNKKLSIANDDEFHAIFTFENSGINILKDNLSINEVFISLLSEKIKILSEKYNKYILENALSQEYSQYCVFLKKLGLSDNNACRFINGHVFEEKIILPIFNIIKKKIQHNEIQKVVDRPQGNEKQSKELMRKIRNHFKEKCNIPTLINCNMLYEKNYIYEKIIDKASRIYT